ncbi:MAG: NADH-quinone oxidoreductase subunit NuoE [Lachnospirales bacterium]
MNEAVNNEVSQEDLFKLREIITSYKDEQGALMTVLHKTQELFGYIPYQAQQVISNVLDIPISEIYTVITFYAHFSLTPVGKYKVCLCMGTACYVKGSGKVLEVIERDLGIRAGETTDDGQFTIEATRCIGACGLAPVMSVNDDVHGRLNNEEVLKVLEKYK